MDLTDWEGRDNRFKYEPISPNSVSEKGYLIGLPSCLREMGPSAQEREGGPWEGKSARARAGVQCAGAGLCEGHGIAARLPYRVARGPAFL